MHSSQPLKTISTYNLNGQLVTPGPEDGASKAVSLFCHPYHQTGTSYLGMSLSFTMLQTMLTQKEALYKREKYRRQLTELLYETGYSLSETLNLDKVFHLALTYLAEFMPYDRAAVMLKYGSDLTVVANRGFPTAVQHTQLTVSLETDNVFQQVCHAKQPLFVSDVWRHPDGQEIADLPPGRTWVGIPLIYAGEVTGMLSVSCKAPNAYIDDQIKLAAKFAKQVAVALENARTHQTMLNLSQGLKELLLERTHNLQVAQAELDYLDEAKSNFVSIASHELRTPLTTLQGYSQILLQNEVVKKDAYLSDLMSTIHSSSVRLHEIINAMLDVAKIDSQTLELYRQPVSLTPLVRKVAEKFDLPLAERQQQLEVKGLQALPDIEADVDMLEKVFRDIISNGIKYTPDGGHMTISGHYHQREQKIEIIISDNGIGIDPQFHELIFTKFYRADNLVLHSTGKTKFKGAGPGLGLTIARGIIEMHGGKIWVESPGRNEKTCPGSRFHILLPVSKDC